MFLSSFLGLFCLLALSTAHSLHSPLRIVQDEDAQSVSSDQLLALFRKLNSETSEVFSNIAAYLKEMAAQNPTDESIQRYQAATALLKSLQRSKMTFDKAAIERKHDQGSQDVLVMDEDTGEVIQAKSWGGFLKGAAAFGKGVLKGALSDEDQDDIEAKSWGGFLKGAAAFGKGVLKGALSDEDQEDIQDAPLSNAVLKRGKTDLKIASTLLTKDGPFADVLADPEARISAGGVGQIVGKVGKTLLGLFG